MRAIALGCIALALSTTASAGPIADQFAAGVGGVSWGMTLDELIGIHEIEAQLRRDHAPHGGLAGSHEANKRQIMVLPRLTHSTV